MDATLQDGRFTVIAEMEDVCKPREGLLSLMIALF